MFDIQRFAEEQAIPAELAGVSEEVARNIMAQASDTGKPATDSPVDANNPNDVKVSYSRFKETLDQKNEVERQLAAYREKFGDLNTQPQAQPNYPPQQNYQPQQGYQQPQQQTAPPVQNLTEDLIKNFEDAITYGAKQLSGFSDEQVDELDYLDDDDPRIKQWNFAKRIAESAVYNNYLSAQFAQQQEMQRQAMIQNQTASAFNDYTTRQQADENFNAVRQFATTDFYNSLNDIDKWTISNAQSHIMNNTASPSDFKVIRDFFSSAKAEYDSRNKTPLPFKGNTAPQFPRTDKVNGVSGGGGGINNASLAEMMRTVPWSQIPQEYKQILLQ